MLRCALLCTILVAELLLPKIVVAQPSQRSVLVLDQSSAFLPFNAAVASAIRATVNADSRWRISFYSEHLDANRFFGPAYEHNFVQFLKAKYRDRPIDVVVVFGISALDFMVRRRDEVWPSVPVVFAAIDDSNHRKPDASEECNRGHHATDVAGHGQSGTHGCPGFERCRNGGRPSGASDVLSSFQRRNPGRCRKIRNRRSHGPAIGRAEDAAWLTAQQRGGHLYRHLL